MITQEDAPEGKLVLCIKDHPVYNHRFKYLRTMPRGHLARVIVWDRESGLFGAEFFETNYWLDPEHFSIARDLVK